MNLALFWYRLLHNACLSFPPFLLSPPGDRLNLLLTCPSLPPLTSLPPTVRILVVLHLVLHFCYQSFGPAVFQNLYLRRFAEWGSVQYSTLLCLEGMILAIRYGRSRGGSKESEDDEEEREAPEASSFFKRHALEVCVREGKQGGKQGGREGGRVLCFLFEIAAAAAAAAAAASPQ